MLVREFRLGVAIAIAFVVTLGWSSRAHAAYSMNPGTIATPTTLVGVASGAATGSLSQDAGGNPRIDLVVGNCTGASGSFALTPNTNIPMNNPATISVTYTPDATNGAGLRTCTVNIFANGTTTSALGSFTVTGRGERPPSIMLNNASLAFTAVRFFAGAVAQKSSTRQLQISNGGDRDLTVSLGNLGTEFSLDAASAGQLTDTVGGGTSKTWTFRFDPTSAGAKTTNMSVTHNAGGGALSVTLTGDGTTGDFTINANGGAFGTVVAGTTAGLDVTVTHSGGAPKGTLTIKSATVVTTNGNDWFTITAAPSTLTNATQTGIVSVQCAPPAGATQMAQGRVSIVADSDGSAGPNFDETLTADVTCTGGSSALALADNITVLNFGNQLVGTPTTAQMLTLRNEGTQDASVLFTSNSTNRMRFTVTGPGGCGVTGNPCAVPMSNGSVVVTATFTPDAEGSISASFTATPVTGAGPSFTLNGRGIDRHISLPESLLFNDTFRNPGDAKATVTPLTVTNTGEAPLQVDEIVINDDSGVWTVVEPVGAFEVPPVATTDVLVRFAPMVAGKSMATMLIRNNDARVAGGMPAVILEGNGKDRNVDFNPGAVDVGDTFAGVPTRLSINKPMDMLTVVNSELPDDARINDFRIKAIMVEGPDADAFEVVGLDDESIGDRMLPAGQSVALDVIFAPSRVGDFEASLVLYLDDDPVPMTPVPVRGRALFVDAHGSGGFGCSTGHNGSRGMMLLVIGALALVLRRRRR